MFGLPPDLDLQFFRDKGLIQVCIGIHDLILNFDGNVSVTITSTVSCVAARSETRRYEDFRDAAPSLLNLLHKYVSLASGDEAGTLTLKFNDGSILNIYNDSQQFESYVIKHEDRMIIV